MAKVIFSQTNNSSATRVLDFVKHGHTFNVIESNKAAEELELHLESLVVADLLIELFVILHHFLLLICPIHCVQSHDPLESYR